MVKERICYFCKKCENVGMFSPDYQCKDSGKKVESSDSCSEREDYEEK